MSTPDQLELFPAPEGPAELPAHVYPLPLGRVTHCRSCNAEVVWATSPSGAHIPLSYATRRQEGGRWVATSHYRSCPQASSWGGTHAKS